MFVCFSHILPSNYGTSIKTRKMWSAYAYCGLRLRPQPTATYAGGEARLPYPNGLRLWEHAAAAAQVWSVTLPLHDRSKVTLPERTSCKARHQKNARAGFRGVNRSYPSSHASSLTVVPGLLRRSTDFPGPSRSQLPAVQSTPPSSS